MMRFHVNCFLLPIAALVVAAPADELQDRISSRSERVVLEKATAVEKAQIESDHVPEYGYELRTRVTDDDVGLGLRIFLPDRWDKQKLREQLIYVAASEQLRVSALEWQELMEAYRGFCDYRMITAKLALYDKELAVLEPYLKMADEAVGLNQLSVVDRAKFYSLYLDLVNGHEDLKADLLVNEQGLRLLLGADADLNRMAGTAKVDMPRKAEFDSLLKEALKNRADYRQHDIQARAYMAAEQNAGAKERFWLRYIQPEYAVDYDSGDETFGLSAAVVLPWGTRNSDIAVYQHQRMLAHSSMQLQRLVIEHRLQVLLKSAKTYYDSAAERNSRINPLLKQVSVDMEKMDTGRLEDMRDILLVRERIFDISLQSAEAISRKEKIAVDLAEELGFLVP